MSDAGHIADLSARPGADTRGWVTHGQVAVESGGAKSVLFDDETGNPHPLGAVVLVKLQPSGNVVPCRVANSCAGDGEGEWHPFTGGDEVIVTIPDGDEKNGGVITGRLNQSYDRMPRLVAGQDVTNNSVAYKRLVAPYVLESGTSIILRVSTTGSALTLDPTGNVYLSAGSGIALYMRSDAVSLQLKDAQAAYQLDPSDGSATIVAADGNSVVRVDGAADGWQTAGTISFSAGGNAAGNHVATIEGVLAILQAYSEIIGTAIAGITGSGSAAGAAIELLATTGMGAVLTAAMAAPPTPSTVAAIVAALQTPKAAGAPGIGSQGVLVD